MFVIVLICDQVSHFILHELEIGSWKVDGPSELMIIDNVPF